jgi:hypothetical protein
MFKIFKASALAAALSTLLIAAPSAHAGAIPFDTFLQFSFDSPGSVAKGCDPADPAGNFCIASSGTPTQFLDAPGWSFDAPAGATVTVVDQFTSGDRFQIFDNGVLLGSTGALFPRQPEDCGDDPVNCLANPFIDSATFVLGAGSHLLTLIATDSPGGLGAGFLRVTAAVVPEPTSVALVLAALAAAGGLRRRSISASISGGTALQGAAA